MLTFLEKSHLYKYLGSDFAADLIIFIVKIMLFNKYICKLVKYSKYWHLSIAFVNWDEYIKQSVN